MRQSSSPYKGDTELETHLRTASPALPPALRARTLIHCAALRDEHRHNRRRGHLRWAWTMAGLCAFHWGAMSYFDAQRASLIQGKHSAPLVATATTSATELRVALEAHSRLLAKMTRETTHSVENIRIRDAG